eukprot:3664005-Pleurochrysis_carterae.AAC.1
MRAHVEIYACVHACVPVLAASSILPPGRSRARSRVRRLERADASVRVRARVRARARSCARAKDLRER